MEMEKKNLKTCMEPQIAKAMLRKKSNAEGIKLSDFKVYCKATII